MLQALIPSLIAGAVEIFKDKQARRENIKKPSTVTGAGLIGTAISAAVSPEVVSQAVVAAGMPADTLEGALTQLAMAVVGVIMVLYRKGKTGAHP